jgi:outer membrane protein
MHNILNTTSLLFNSRGSVASALLSRDREGADARSLMTLCLKTSVTGIVLCGLAFGQTPAPARLTLAQAEALAIKNHPQVATARNVAAAAGQHVVEAKAQYYPTVDGEVTASQGLFGSRIGAGFLSASRLFDREGDGLQLTQLVTDFGRRSSLVANSRLLAQAAEQNTQATTYDVVFGVNKAYFGVLQAQAYVNVAQETVKARQTLTDQVVALANANLKSQVDVQFVEVNLSEAKLMLIRAQDAVKRAYADLARALGEDQSIEYQLEEAPPAPPPPDSTDSLVAEAIQNRPELHELRLRFTAAQRFEEAEKDLKHPNVTLLAVGGGLPYISNPTSSKIPLGYEAVAVNLEIPIFNGHLFSARAEAAHYESLAEDQRLRNQQQAIERDVRTAWIAASTAFQSIPVTEQLMRQTQLALELAQGRYQLGLSSIVEITQAQLNLTQAQIENVAAKYDYQSAFAGLQYTIGALR